MADTTVEKINAVTAPKGTMGQRYLASGLSLAMRLWEKEPVSETTPTSVRDCEIVGYALEGRAEIQSEGQNLILELGDCWLVPQGARHSYSVLEPFTAVEATSPPARVHARDESAAGLE